MNYRLIERFLWLLRYAHILLHETGIRTGRKRGIQVVFGCRWGSRSIENTICFYRKCSPFLLLLIFFRFYNRWLLCNTWKRILHLLNHKGLIFRRNRVRRKEVAVELAWHFEAFRLILLGTQPEVLGVTGGGLTLNKLLVATWKFRTLSHHLIWFRGEWLLQKIDSAVALKVVAIKKSLSWLALEQR